MKIKVKDKVRVVAGKDKGREGTVERVYSKDSTVLVGGVNMYKKHIRKSEQMPQGGVAELPRPLHVAKVVLICPKCNKPARVGYSVEKGKKTRICKHCKSAL